MTQEQYEELVEFPDDRQLAYMMDMQDMIERAIERPRDEVELR